MVSIKLDDIDPQGWLADVLARIAKIKPAAATNWKPGTAVQQAA